MKIEFELTPSIDHSETELGTVKVGAPVDLVATFETAVEVRTHDNNLLLGLVPSEHVSILNNYRCKSQIRSIRRERTGGRVHAVLIRIEASEKLVDEDSHADFNETNEEGGEPEEEGRLTKHQLATLVKYLYVQATNPAGDSEVVQRYLRDERLRRIIANIDGVPDRDSKLVEALKCPEFKEFSDKVLEAVEDLP